MKPMMQHDLSGGPVAEQDYGKVLGAPFKVYLKNGVHTEIDQATGKVMTSITDLPGLITAIARCRISHPRRLSGADLRFIRSALRLKSKTLAAVLDLTPEFYSRCESGQKAMSNTTEKLYRSYAFVITFLSDEGVKSALRKERGKKKDRAPEDAQAALESIGKLFSDLRISSAFPVGDELSFVFSRRCPDENTPCGDDDAKWENQARPLAA